MVAISEYSIRKKPIRALKARPRNYGKPRCLTEPRDINENEALSFSMSFPEQKPGFQMTIEQYISTKPKPWLQSTASSQVQSPIVASKAVDEAYDFLFKQLSGGCNGLNVVTSPNLEETKSEQQPGDISVTAPIRFLVVVYVEPGISHCWDSIENGLKQIFRVAAENEIDGSHWSYEGTAFELRAASPSK